MRPAFSRFNKIVQMAMAAISASATSHAGKMSVAEALSSVGGYRSRGKGKNRSKPARWYGNSQSWGQKHTTGRKEDRKCESRQFMATVNGFEIMQTRPSSRKMGDRI
jgi:hypothetical protein